MHALIVCDDNDLNEYLSLTLRRLGVEVSYQGSWEAVLRRWADRPADLIFLRAQLVSEAQELAAIQPLGNPFLVLMLETPGEAEAAALLSAGADLILRLPVGPQLLTAHIQALLRRISSAGVNLLPGIDLGGVMLNPASRSVVIDDQPPILLTQLEFRLLYLLMTHPGQVIPAEVIVDRVWGYGESGSRELVRGLVSRVRAKVEPDPGAPLFIHTLPGVGYLFDPQR